MEDGFQASDWVSVSTGEGTIKVLPPEGGVKAPYQRVAFVLDASASQLDGWLNNPWDKRSGLPKTKWEWQKELIHSDRVASKFSGVQMSLVVFGGGFSPFQENCPEASLKFKMGPFDQPSVIKILDKIEPKGVSSLAHGIQLVARAKEKKDLPQKIIVITDGPDACTDSIPSSVKELFQNNSPMTMDVILMGPSSPKNKEWLEKLASAGLGRIIEVQNGLELIEAVSNLLSLDYHLTIGDKPVSFHDIDGKEYRQRIGDYDLKIEMDPPFKGGRVAIRNGQKTEVRLFIEGNETKIKLEP